MPQKKDERKTEKANLEKRIKTLGKEFLDLSKGTLDKNTGIISLPEENSSDEADEGATLRRNMNGIAQSIATAKEDLETIKKEEKVPLKQAKINFENRIRKLQKELKKLSKLSKEKLPKIDTISLPNDDFFSKKYVEIKNKQNLILEAKEELDIIKQNIEDVPLLKQRIDAIKQKTLQNPKKMNASDLTKEIKKLEDMKSNLDFYDLIDKHKIEGEIRNYEKKYDNNSEMIIEPRRDRSDTMFSGLPEKPIPRPVNGPKKSDDHYQGLPIIHGPGKK